MHLHILFHSSYLDKVNQRIYSEIATKCRKRMRKRDVATRFESRVATYLCSHKYLCILGMIKIFSKKLVCQERRTNNSKYVHRRNHLFNFFKFKPSKNHQIPMTHYY